MDGFILYAYLRHNRQLCKPGTPVATRPTGSSCARAHRPVRGNPSVIHGLNLIRLRGEFIATVETTRWGRHPPPLLVRCSSGLNYIPSFLHCLRRHTYTRFAIGRGDRGRTRWTLGAAPCHGDPSSPLGDLLPSTRPRRRGVAVAAGRVLSPSPETAESPARGPKKSGCQEPLE
ncbi:unnamed protein product [Ixodes persulcatus]